jgi:O-Antigen ligase
LVQRKQLALLRDPLIVWIGVYAALHMLALAWMSNGLLANMSGLLIDLRYLLFFVLTYVAVRLYPQSGRTFVRVGISGALVVVVFALLQITVLPHDALKYIGYSTDTIVPYLTVDQNTDFIRINSTMRGPNPLGAYAVIVLAGVVAWLLGKQTKPSGQKTTLVVATLLLGSIAALWASYSRSALIAAIGALLIVVVVMIGRRIGKRTWIITAAVSVVGILAIIMSSGSNFVSNVILHENPTEGNNVNSNQGHVTSLQDGIARLWQQPYGAGVGSSGSASLYTDAPLIIENQYLFIAHEVGWAGLIVFMLIFVGILRRLWRRRHDWLGLTVFASGIGLAIIGVLLPVWTDDAVSIVWWGLAGLVVGGRSKKL